MGATHLMSGSATDEAPEDKHGVPFPESIESFERIIRPSEQPRELNFDRFDGSLEDGTATSVVKDAEKER